MAPRVLVLGGNFAGLTAALSVKQEVEVDDDVDVTVVRSPTGSSSTLRSSGSRGKQKVKDVIFPVAQTFESHGVEFVHGEATRSTSSEEGGHLTRRALPRPASFDFDAYATTLNVGSHKHVPSKPGSGSGHAIPIWV